MYIQDISISSEWDAKVENWKFTMTLHMSNDVQNKVYFWGNKIDITKDRISFGSELDYITTVDDKACLVKPSCFGKPTYTPFNAGFEDIAYIFKNSYWVEKFNDSYRFCFKQNLHHFFHFTSCTCISGECHECGVLECGCIDLCRGRCEW